MCPRWLREGLPKPTCSNTLPASSVRVFIVTLTPLTSVCVPTAKGASTLFLARINKEQNALLVRLILVESLLSVLSEISHSKTLLTGWFQTSKWEMTSSNSNCYNKRKLDGTRRQFRNYSSKVSLILSSSCCLFHVKISIFCSKCCLSLLNTLAVRKQSAMLKST